MKKEKIEELANQIVALEKAYQQGDSEKMKELEQLVTQLSIEDMLIIDEYIYQKKLLT